jgi:hypothetical protein
MIWTVVSGLQQLDEFGDHPRIKWARAGIKGIKLEGLHINFLRNVAAILCNKFLKIVLQL